MPSGVQSSELVELRASLLVFSRFAVAAGWGPSLWLPVGSCAFLASVLVGATLWGFAGGGPTAVDILVERRHLVRVDWCATGPLGRVFAAVQLSELARVGVCQVLAFRRSYAIATFVAFVPTDPS